MLCPRALLCTHEFIVDFRWQLCSWTSLFDSLCVFCDAENKICIIFLQRLVVAVLSQNVITYLQLGVVSSEFILFLNQKSIKHIVLG